MKKNWLIFGLYGGLLNFLLLLVVMFVLIYGDTTGAFLQVFLITFLPGFVLWVLGGRISKKEYNFSKLWMVIFTLLTFILWGIIIVVVTSYLWYNP